MTTEHIPGILNTTADAISHNNISLFQSLVPQTPPVAPPQTMMDLIVNNGPDWGSHCWTYLFTSSLVKDSPLPQKQSTSLDGVSTSASATSSISLPYPTEHSQTAFAACLFQWVGAGLLMCQ